ncbi:MAG: kinase [Armatimonadetes bacterium]|nr:kinase [Armatimonadota bacterium]
MQYVIGVDGGATKTFALVAQTDGTIVGFGKSGCGSYEMAGIEAAKSNILDAIEQALSQKDTPRNAVELGCFALAGADFYPEDFDLLEKAMRELGVAKQVIIRNDSIAGLRAGTFRPYGVCIIMGTGFNGAGIGKDGTEVRFFGEGYIFGDLGGGGAIARDALFHAMRAYDGRGKPTVLMQKALDHWGAKDMEELARILYYNKESLKKISPFCPKVFEAAFDGDEVAQGIIRKFGEEAGISANALIRRLGFENEEFECVMAGSVFKGKGTLMMDTVRSIVLPVAPKARVITPRYEPVVGALMLALEAAGVQIEGNAQFRLDNSVPNELKRE